MSRSSKHLNEAAFLVSLDDFVNRDLTFSYCDIKLLLDLLRQVNNSLSGYTVEDSAIVRRSD